MNPEIPSDPQLEQLIEFNKKGTFGLRDAMASLPEQEQDTTRELIDIIDTAHDKNKIEKANRTSNFIKNLKNEGYLDEDLRKTRLFNLLSGGSEPLEVWANMPQDLPDGEIEHFIREELGSIKPEPNQP